uniref:Cleavage and polyadenylation specificity factor subunit 4 n=1 Tax=Strigamia maritima TaxID=126957 RepID=T1IGR2_STRMM
MDAGKRKREEECLFNHKDLKRQKRSYFLDEERDLQLIKFDIEYALEQQLGALPLPFAGMDKSGAAVCEFFIRSTCRNGDACPFRHLQSRSDRTVVCKHWLRGLCKKGERCEFLHEYVLSKMDECQFYSKYRVCNNVDCQFLHIDPESKITACPWYDRGHCRRGPSCRYRHTRKVICENYLSGLICPKKENCKFAHPKFELSTEDVNKTIVFCGESNTCVKRPTMHAKVGEQKYAKQSKAKKSYQVPDQNQVSKHYRPLEQVTCFKCGDIGHYANKCTKKSNRK